LERHELTVAELTAITQVPQSSLSAHLGKLRDAGLLRDRKAGTSCFYSLKDGAMPQGARDVWSFVRDKTKDPVLEADRARCKGVLEARAKDQAWPDAIAGEMDRHYSPGRTWESLARGLVGLFDLGEVLDVGSGDGAVAQLLAPQAKKITCVDKS